MSERYPLGVVAALHAAVEAHTHTSGLAGEALAPGATLALRSLRAEQVLAGEVALTDALDSRLDTRTGQVGGDLELTGSLRVGGALEVAGDVILAREPQAGPLRVFTTCTGKPESEDAGGGQRVATLRLPAQGPGRWLILLVGGVQVTGSEHATGSAELRLRLVLLGPRGGRQQELWLPLGPAGGTTRAAEPVDDFAAWVAALPGQGAWPAGQSVVLYHPRPGASVQEGLWTAPLSFSVCLPCPGQDALLEVLANVSSPLVGRALVQAVYLPRRGVL